MHIYTAGRNFAKCKNNSENVCKLLNDVYLQFSPEKMVNHFNGAK